MDKEILHNPTVILHSGQICLKFWETEEPNQKYMSAHYAWLASARIVPFRDQDETRRLLFNSGNYYDAETFEDFLLSDSGIPLNSIASRITIQDGMAVINPVEVVESETQEELFKELIDLFDTTDKHSYGYATLINVAKKQFTIKRKDHE